MDLPQPNPPANKFFDVVGEVVKRIHNPTQVGINTGKKYKVCYLVIKWVSGKQGEYVDYLKIKTLEAKKIADIREGYIVRVPLLYSCSIRTDDVEYRTRNVNGVTVQEPNLWPEWTIPKNKEIEIINSDMNYEAKHQPNNQFENEVVNKYKPIKEDDLPF